MTTRFFFDTEFIEDGRTIELISIGMVAARDEQPRAKTFYAINLDCDHRRADKWVLENVIDKLPKPGESKASKLWMSRRAIRDEIEKFIRAEKPPYEFWAYFADYDWVVFCQLFGKMIDLPDGFPMYCNDLKQEMRRLGLTKDNLPPNENAHDALEDAKWAHRSWLGICAYESSRNQGCPRDVALDVGGLSG